MTKLTPIILDDNTVIYIETTENVEAPPVKLEEPAEEEEEETTTDYNLNPAQLQQQLAQNFQNIQKTIHAYTVYTLNAFKKVAIANVDKVTLEFGIELGGEAGVPYVTKGTAKSNLKITVECSFPEETEQQSQPNQAVPNQAL
jgi:CRISPR/Cas system CMR subunit Cmr6 (Cas7 group RAMP superfamily)